MIEDLDGFYPAIEEKELQEGTMKLVSVEDTKILFIKHQGKIFAIDNRCPHLGCGFSGGSLEGSMVVCPCHDWRFSLESGEYELNPSYKLTFYEYKIVLGKIWVKLDEF